MFMQLDRFDQGLLGQTSFINSVYNMNKIPTNMILIISLRFWRDYQEMFVCTYTVFGTNRVKGACKSRFGICMWDACTVYGHSSSYDQCEQVKLSLRVCLYENLGLLRETGFLLSYFGNACFFL